MEKKSYCVVCKYYGVFEDDRNLLDKAQLFDDDGTSLSITLCRNHAVDLFKRGQRRFLINHHKILFEPTLDEDIGFASLLQKTVRRNYNTIF